MTVPYLPGAVIAWLLADATVTAAVGSAIGTRTPADLTAPFLRIQLVDNTPISARRGVFKPLVQADAIAPPGGTRDPEAVAWDLASLVAASLDRANNVIYRNIAWSGHTILGPQPLTDVSRGPDTPLYRAIVHAELTVGTP